MTSNQYNYFVCLHAIYHYKLAEALPVGEEATFEQLAEKCKLNVPDLRRLVRQAISNRMFKEVRKGVVGHSAVSKLLAIDPLFRDYIGMGCEEVWGAAVEVFNPSPRALRQAYPLRQFLLSSNGPARKSHPTQYEICNLNRISS